MKTVLWTVFKRGTPCDRGLPPTSLNTFILFQHAVALIECAPTSCFNNIDYYRYILTSCILRQRIQRFKQAVYSLHKNKNFFRNIFTKLCRLFKNALTNPQFVVQYKVAEFICRAFSFPKRIMQNAYFSDAAKRGFRSDIFALFLIVSRRFGQCGAAR